MLVCVMLASACPASAVESGPQDVVRNFCRADALGRRLDVQAWAEFGPFISWPLEPAWDSAVLVMGYEVGPPRPAEGGALEVDVKYSVVGQVSAFGLETGPHVETVTFRVNAPEIGWRILGPPPPPHIFATRVDVEAMVRSLRNGTPRFLSDSLFVWQMYRSAGWNVPYQRTADLLASGAYRVVEKPQRRDVVVYLRDEVPYHAGLLEAEHSIVSSSLNAGLVHTAVDAFPGDVRYLRLIQPQPAPAPGLATRPHPVRKATPATAQTPSHGSQRRKAQPSAHRRVRKPGSVVRPTPVARGGTP